mmetsp:Transcript_55899/g.154082  ORF Transcript_55899/g.154082 Transcript_55899/m.154082 type:complete len:133 (+) Transcript_55899:423-821(+)
MMQAQASLLPPAAAGAPPGAAGDGGHQEGGHQEVTIDLPPNARPGMVLQIKLKNGQAMQVTVPQGFRPGQKLTLKIRRNNIVNLHPHPGRQMPRDASTGELMHMLPVQGVRTPPSQMANPMQGTRHPYLIPI